MEQICNDVIAIYTRAYANSQACTVLLFDTDDCFMDQFMRSEVSELRAERMAHEVVTQSILTCFDVYMIDGKVKTTAIESITLETAIEKLNQVIERLESTKPEAYNVATSFGRLTFRKTITAYGLSMLLIAAKYSR